MSVGLTGYKKTPMAGAEKIENYKHGYCNMGIFPLQSHDRANLVPMTYNFIIQGRIYSKGPGSPLP